MRRRLDRGVWVTYLLVGAALALFRVSLLAWVEHRSVTHGMTEAVYNLPGGCAVRDSWASTLLWARFILRV
jgi:inner membrane protein involved in colicin E2 resistance